jgi:hypothetical protein
LPGAISQKGEGRGLFAEEEPESIKVMASKRELKARFEEGLAKVIDDIFR